MKLLRACFCCMVAHLARDVLDDWLRDIAPSDELRRWFGHDLACWDELPARHRCELEEDAHQAGLEKLRALAQGLVFAARDSEHCNAQVLCSRDWKRSDS